MSVRKLAGMLFIVNGIEFLLGAGILLGLQLNVIDYSELLLDLSICLVLLCSILAAAGIFSVVKYQKDCYQESLKDLEKLNEKLREQRHDYLNQLQIVYGLLELEEYEDAREYLRPVFKDIMKVNRALRTSHPAVNALLQAKLEAAAGQSVDFYLEVGTQLRELPMEAWEFCKVLANLIDNAVTAAGEREGERWVRLTMEEQPEGYRIRVANNGPEIPEGQRKQIFGWGYTTKRGEGHGMGLAIVSSILKEAGGTISVESAPDETMFEVRLPRRGGHGVPARPSLAGRRAAGRLWNHRRRG